MKKLFLFLNILLFLSMLSINANAKVRRVGYTGISVAGTDYPSLQSAHDNSTAGDTLYIFPGANGQSATFTKRLITIGYGYFNNVSRDSTLANAGLQNIVGDLSFSVVLNAGSDSCSFLGLDGLSLQITSATVTVSNILVNRCRVNIYYNTSYYTVAKNWTITQSYIGTVENSNSFLNRRPYFQNLLIQNSYLSNFDLNETLIAGSSGFLINNVVKSANFYSSQFIMKNNIFLGAHSNDGACNYTYNCADSTYPLTNTGTNTNNKNFKTTTLNTNFFIGYATIGTTSYDERWKLKLGSPAIGAGEGGADAGMYGGSDPYQLSGIPPIPAFYKLTAPSTTASSNPYTITFSVRSNN